MSINSDANLKSLGDITREIIKTKGIKSPPIEGRVEIRPGLWVVPREGDDIEKLKEKYNKDRLIKINVKKEG
jgi:hypothetical protein